VTDVRTASALVTLVFAFAGCAGVSSPPGGPRAGTAFHGEVWNWDERESTVTLLTGTGTVRVKVSPDQLRWLRLHQLTTVHGEIDPPAPIPHTVVEPPELTPVAVGTPDTVETAGTISAVDPSGLVSIDSPRGRLVVWTVAPSQAFRAGTAARVRVSVQRVEMVPPSDPRAATAAARWPEPADRPLAPPPAEAGDHAVVTGGVLSVDPGGSLAVDSPRGPVIVAVSDASRFRKGMMVQVRTLLEGGP
jgi:hypothetical protein